MAELKLHRHHHRHLPRLRLHRRLPHHPSQNHVKSIRLHPNQINPKNAENAASTIINRTLRTIQNPIAIGGGTWTHCHVVKLKSWKFGAILTASPGLKWKHAATTTNCNVAAAVEPVTLWVIEPTLMSWGTRIKWVYYYQLQEGLCSAFDPSSEENNGSDKDSRGMKGALHAISLFEEFKKSRDLHDAFRRLVRLSIIARTLRNSINRKTFDCRKNCAITSIRVKRIPTKTKYQRKAS